MKKEEIYQRVTEKITAALEEAGSWQSMVTGNGSVPLSIAGYGYHGINYLSLMAEAVEKKYASNVWGTFRAMGNYGGYVRKGEKGTPIIFWKLMEVHDRESGEAKQIPFLRYSYVFNAGQVEWQTDAGPKRIAELEPISSNETIRQAEEIVEGWEDCPEIVNSKLRSHASYVPSIDIVNMPELGMFASSDYYYLALFHELVHSTGHESRLDRGLTTEFGNHDYSKEELVAELGAAFLSHFAKLDVDIKHSAAYIKGWKRRLEANTDWIVWAAGRASKAANMILENQKVSREVEEVAV